LNRPSRLTKSKGFVRSVVGFILCIFPEVHVNCGPLGTKTTLWLLKYPVFKYQEPVQHKRTACRLSWGGRYMSLGSYYSCSGLLCFYTVSGCWHYAYPGAPHLPTNIWLRACGEAPIGLPCCSWWPLLVFHPQQELSQKKVCRWLLIGEFFQWWFLVEICHVRELIQSHWEQIGELFFPWSAAMSSVSSIFLVVQICLLWSCRISISEVQFSCWWVQLPFSFRRAWPWCCRYQVLAVLFDRG
jgi:hypothetical protein